MSSARRVAAGAGSLLGLAVLLIGVPVALGALVGWPLPHSWPTWAQLRTLFETSGIPDIVLIDALAIVCWIAWLDFAVATVIEIGAAIAGYPSPRLRIVRPWQPLAARLITMIILATPVLGTRSLGDVPAHHATLAVALADRHGLGTVAVDVPTRGADGVSPVGAHRTVSSQPTSPEYVVRRGDTLWDISARTLRNPRSWPEIWRKNAERSEPGDRRFTDPNLIRPGWTLDLPGVASPAPATPPPTRTSPHPAPSSASSPSPTTPGAPEGLLPPAPEPSRVPPRPTSPSAEASHGKSGVGGSVSVRQPSVITLPSGAVVGLALATALAAAIAAARLHERRRSRVGDGRQSAVEPLLTPALVRLNRAALTAVDETPSEADRAQASMSPTTLLNALRARACGPAELPIGLTADGREQVLVDTSALSGLALVGSAADAAARALLVAAVADHRPWRSEVLVTPAIAGLVDGLPTLINAQVVDSLDAALDLLEEDTVRRGRALALRGSDDYRATLDAADPMDTLLAVLDGAAVGPAEAGRIETVAGLGRRIGIVLLVVGAAAGVETLEVGDGGLLTPAPAALGTATRLSVLSAAEASEMLAVIAAGQGRPVEASANDEAVAALPPATTVQERPVELEASPTREPAAAVQLRVFGPPRVEVGGAEVMTGLRARGRELLALLVVRRDGLRQEELIDALWPDDDADFERSREQLTTAVTSTRRRLRALAEDRRADYILFSGDDRYRLDPAAVDADLWRFEAALQDAARSMSDAERIDALERAVSAGAAEPFAGALFSWAEAIREHLRRRAVDAACELAELHEATGHAGPALAALETALSIDPCREEVYQRLIALQLQLGRIDAARSAYRELTRELDELGMTPSEATAALLQSVSSASAGTSMANPPMELPPSSTQDCAPHLRELSADAENANDADVDQSGAAGLSAVALRRVVSQRPSSESAPDRGRPFCLPSARSALLPILHSEEEDDAR